MNRRGRAQGSLQTPSTGGKDIFVKSVSSECRRVDCRLEEKRQATTGRKHAVREIAQVRKKLTKLAKKKKERKKFQVR